MLGKEEIRVTLSYERKFLFLSPADKGYEFTIGKIPKGHIEIEKKKNKLNFKVFVENLKEMEYQIQLFDSQDESITLGYLLVEEQGKGQASYQTDVENMMGSKKSWNDFDILILRPLEKQPVGKIPLVGWLKGTKRQIPILKEEQKSSSQSKSIKQEDQESSEPIIEQKQEKISQPSLQEREQEQENTKKEDLVQESENISIGFYPKASSEILYKEEEREELKKDSLMTEKDTIEKIDPEEKQSMKEGNEENEKRNLESSCYYINENLDKIETILTPCTPFDPPLKNHKWWKITGQEEVLEQFYLFFNGFFVPLMYPYMKYRNIGEIYKKKYNYKLFGMVCDEKNVKNHLKYYVYGIPGRLCIQEQPFQGNTGFLYWHPAKYYKKEKGAMGYWLLYVDSKTGSIAVPKCPTIPPIL